MTAFLLFMITLGVIIFFFISQSVSKFFPNKRIKYASLIAYTLQFIGLVGLVMYHTEFMSSPPLTVQFNTNSPDFIRALAELLWPVSVILAIFWFLPQILEFLKDPGQSVPIFAAIAGKYTPHEQQAVIESADIERLPAYESLPQVHKDLIELFKSRLARFPANEHENRLLIHAAEQQLAAEFGFIYYLIFGTQIQALQLLNSNERSDLTSFYETHKQKVGDVKEINLASFREWAKFLLDHNLVVEVEGKFSITIKGKEFLRFLEIREYYLLKAF